MTCRNIIVFLALVLLFSCSGHNDKMYVELETCLAKRQEVTKAKEDKIAELKAELNKCNDKADSHCATVSSSTTTCSTPTQLRSI